MSAALPNVLTDNTYKYVYGNGLAYAVDSGSNVQVYHTDGLGSVRSITNGNGTPVASYKTDAFGVPLTTSGNSSQPFQFAGQQRDVESGLYYLRARMYGPASGRFLSRDPLFDVLVNPLLLANLSGTSASRVTRDPYRDPTNLYSWFRGVTASRLFSLGIAPMSPFERNNLNWLEGRSGGEDARSLTGSATRPAVMKPRFTGQSHQSNIRISKTRAFSAWRQVSTRVSSSQHRRKIPTGGEDIGRQ